MIDIEDYVFSFMSKIFFSLSPSACRLFLPGDNSMHVIWEWLPSASCSVFQVGIYSSGNGRWCPSPPTCPSLFFPFFFFSIGSTCGNQLVHDDLNHDDEQNDCQINFTRENDRFDEHNIYFAHVSTLISFSSSLFTFSYIHRYVRTYVSNIRNRLRIYIHIFSILS
jgi:hypothetical protein